jgi:hypothetical protein
MFPFNSVPVDVIPVEIVPSTFQVVLVPLCEGIVVGLVLGAVVMFVISKIDALLARPADAEMLDAQPTEVGLAKGQSSATRRPAPRPALGARALPTRPRRPAGPRPTLLARMT